jgi:hypothetical protein
MSPSGNEPDEDEAFVAAVAAIVWREGEDAGTRTEVKLLILVRGRGVAEGDDAIVAMDDPLE